MMGAGRIGPGQHCMEGERVKEPPSLQAQECEDEQRKVKKNCADTLGVRINVERDVNGENIEQLTTEAEDEEDLENLKKACVSCNACEKYHVFVDSPKELRSFREALLRWFSLHRRKLPWRGDPPPYTSWAETRSATTTATNVAVGGKASSVLTSGQARRRGKKSVPSSGQMMLTSFFGVKTTNGRQQPCETSFRPSAGPPSTTATLSSEGFSLDDLSHASVGNTASVAHAADFTGQPHSLDYDGALATTHLLHDDNTNVCLRSQDAHTSSKDLHECSSHCSTRNSRSSSAVAVPEEARGSCARSSVPGNRTYSVSDDCCNDCDSSTGASSLADMSCTEGSSRTFQRSSTECCCTSEYYSCTSECRCDSEGRCNAADRACKRKRRKWMETKTLTSDRVTSETLLHHQQQHLCVRTSETTCGEEELAAVRPANIKKETPGNDASTDRPTMKPTRGGAATSVGLIVTPEPVAASEATSSEISTALHTSSASTEKTKRSEAPTLLDACTAATVLFEGVPCDSPVATTCPPVTIPESGSSRMRRKKETSRKASTTTLSTEEKSISTPAAPHVTPYGVWVSEVMLQQTQVATVIDYWLRWMRRWPTVEKLATATEEEVQHMWSGLGYYRRARQLLHGARVVVDEYEKQLPMETKQLLSIPGIGPYTAGAIRALAYNVRSAAVDGNVIRVLSRLAGFAAPADGRALATAATEMMPLLLHRQRAAASVEALIELGATVCSPRAPACDVCPLRHFCRARKEVLRLLPPNRDQLHSIRCQICATTFTGAVTAEDYPLPKGSLIRDRRPEEVYAVLLVVIREPSHANHDDVATAETHALRKNAFCLTGRSSNCSSSGSKRGHSKGRSTRRRIRSRIRSSSNSSSSISSCDQSCSTTSGNRKREAASVARRRISSSTLTIVDNTSDTCCSSSSRTGSGSSSLSSQPVKMNQQTLLHSTIKERPCCLHGNLIDQMRKTGVASIHEEIPKYMVLLRRRPSKGLLARQLEAPSILLSKGDGVNTETSERKYDDGISPTELTQNKLSESHRDDSLDINEGHRARKKVSVSFRDVSRIHEKHRVKARTTTTSTRTSTSTTTTPTTTGDDYGRWGQQQQPVATENKAERGKRRTSPVSVRAVAEICQSFRKGDIFVPSEVASEVSFLLNEGKNSKKNQQQQQQQQPASGQRVTAPASAPCRGLSAYIPKKERADSVCAITTLVEDTEQVGSTYSAAAEAVPTKEEIAARGGAGVAATERPPRDSCAEVIDSQDERSISQERSSPVKKYVKRKMQTLLLQHQRQRGNAAVNDVCTTDATKPRYMSERKSPSAGEKTVSTVCVGEEKKIGLLRAFCLEERKREKFSDQQLCADPKTQEALSELLRQLDKIVAVPHPSFHYVVAPRGRCTNATCEESRPRASYLQSHHAQPPSLRLQDG